MRFPYELTSEFVSSIGKRILTIASLSAATLGSAANAQEQSAASQLIAETDAAQRIELTDRLRTISWELPAAACHLYNGVKPDLSAKLLRDTKLETRTILSALRNGDESLQIVFAEENRKLLSHIDRVDEIWTGIDAAALTILDDPKSTEAIKAIKSSAPKMFDETYILLSEISGAYSNPTEMLQLDALLIDLAGRQSMQTQKMAALACEVWTGYGDATIAEELTSSITMFEMGSTALLDGMPALGVVAAPTPEIATKLSKLIADWQDVKMALEQVQDGSADSAAMGSLYERLTKKMYAMDEIVHLYVTYANGRAI